MRHALLAALLFGIACARSNPSFEDGTDMSHPNRADASSDRAGVDSTRPADTAARPPDAAGDAGGFADATGMQPKAVPGLLGYWQFEGPLDTTEVADSSGNRRHGILRGLTPAQAWVPGRFGQGLAVTASVPEAGVEVQADAAIDGLRAFTISAWFRRNESTSMIQRSLFSRQLGTTTNEVFNLTCSTTALVIYVPGTGSQVNFESRALGAAVGGTWTHAAATYDRQWLRLWVNGRLAAENNFVDRLVSSTTPVFIGTNKNPVRSEPFEGTLDEVALFDRALDQAAIQKLANGASVFDL